MIKNLIIKSKKFENRINSFIKKNEIDAWVYRYDTLIRLVFSKKQIKSRVQRDFLEKNKSLKIKNFKKFLFKNKIYYPPSGIIFFSNASKDKNIEYIINSFCQGLYKYFKK